MLHLKQARVRTMMCATGVDAVFAMAPDNVFYLANWPRHRPSVHEGAYGALVAPECADPVIFVSEGDSAAVRADHLFDDIRTVPPWQGDWPPVIQGALTDYGLVRRVIGLDRPAQDLTRSLEAALPEAHFVSAAKLLANARMVKNAEELKAYEYAVNFVGSAVSSAMDLVRSGRGPLTEMEISARANYELLRNGVYNADIWCTSGHRTAPLRRYPSEKLVEPQEFFLVDGGGSCNGYRSEFARTVWTGGTPTSEQKAIYRAVFDGLAAAKRGMIPGNLTSDLERACLEVIRGLGYDAYYGGYPYTGHGIGIRAEPPYVTARYPKLDMRLEAGMIINLEPGIWKPGVGGVRIEDTVLVTPTGPQVLSVVPYEEDFLI